MRSTVDKSGPIRDAKWLMDKLVGLLEDASAAEKPNHKACAQYATLLWKMLPKGNAQPSASVLRMIQGKLAEEAAE